MRVRRIVAGVAATVMVAGLGIAGAVPASAADRSAMCSFVIGDSGASSLTGASWNGVGATFAAGEEISAVIRVVSGSPVLSLQVPSGTTRDSGAAPTTLTYTTAGGEGTLRLLNSGTGTFGYAISCTAAPDPAPPIPAWVQAYGRDGADATCESGWNPSWQKWAKEITGGWVCTRSIPSLG
jgi:hypothetical protein